MDSRVDTQKTFMPHDLLWISGEGSLSADASAPRWVQDVLLDVPVVVVRRAVCDGKLVPVGVRGRTRSERYAALLPVSCVSKRIAPEQLVREQAWRNSARLKNIPAIQALEKVAEEWSYFGFAWGPTGSIGFELATGYPVATPESDLDLVLRSPDRMPQATAQALLKSVQGLGAAVDVQIETPFGCISLLEYGGVSSATLLMRTCSGPMLLSDPWAPQQGALQ